MDPQKVREREARCIQEQPPFCTAACPIHVDVRGLIERVRKSDFKGGFAVFAQYVPLPGILARICDRPCEASCKRAEAGDAVRIGALEEACAEFGSPAPARRRAAPNPARVAIAGGGLSGLSCAVELATKGYGVAVFESAPRLLVRVRALGRVADGIVEKDLAVLERLEVEVHTGTAVGGLDALAREFDAVYAAVGRDGALEIDPVTLVCRVGQANVFAGGSCRRDPAEPYSAIRSVQDGKSAAISIDRFLQHASLSAAREPAGPFQTRLYMNVAGYKPEPAVEPAEAGHGYTREEAVREASRCFPCGCLECAKVCPYLKHYKSYPRRYVREIYNNECIVMGARPANRMINSCALCGLCAEVCPEKVSMAEVCLEARQGMVARGKMPASAHEFALRDLEFSSSDAFTLARHAPGCTSSAAVFFPGCQLAASSPGHVFRTYQYLRQNISGGVGLMLGCCGAPAHWAGNQSKFEESREALEEAWSGLGSPRVIVACSSCYRMLVDHLPQIPVEPLWSVLERIATPTAGEGGGTVGQAFLPADPLSSGSWPAGKPAAARIGCPTTGGSAPGAARMGCPTPCRLAIHDPCSTRGVEEVEGSARRLLARLGGEVVELNPARQTTCCGFGGLVRFANPEVADKMVAARIAQSPEDYVTYCAMCRDSFARQGKRALHLLDLVFPGENGADPAARPDPGFSRRRENRARLKRRLLAELWSGPTSMADQEQPEIRVEISETVAALMERRMILVEDVRAVIAHAEATGEKLEDPATGHFIASRRPACVTFWVEYSANAAGGGFAIHNAYSHRMQVG